MLTSKHKFLRFPKCWIWTLPMTQNELHWNNCRTRQHSAMCQQCKGRKVGKTKSQESNFSVTYRKYYTYYATYFSYCSFDFKLCRLSQGKQMFSLLNCCGEVLQGQTMGIEHDGFAWHDSNKAHKPLTCIALFIRVNHEKKSVYNKRHLVTMIILP